MKRRSGLLKGSGRRARNHLILLLWSPNLRVRRPLEHPREPADVVAVVVSDEDAPQILRAGAEGSHGFLHAVRVAPDASIHERPAVVVPEQQDVLAAFFGPIASTR